MSATPITATTKVNLTPGTATRRSAVSEEKFGEFELHERLGIGGTGVVHRATWRRRTGGEAVEVALKRLHQHLLDDVNSVQAFVNEAQVAASMHHRNICQFLDAGRIDGQPYIVLELIEGVKLSRLLHLAYAAQAAPPVDVVVYLISQLCDALDHAHHARDRDSGKRLGLIHRDVTPANIIVSADGELKLLDFGIAKSAWNPYRTATGVIKGTRGYMAPEVVLGAAADTSADIFAAGVIAWELITARPLFGGTRNEIDTLERAVACVVPAPTAFNSACPPELAAAVLKAVQRDWRARWPTAGDMAEALRGAAAGARLRPSMAGVSNWRAQLEGNIPIPTTGTSDEELDLVIVGATTSIGTTSISPRQRKQLPPLPRRLATGTARQRAPRIAPGELPSATPPAPYPPEPVSTSSGPRRFRAATPMSAAARWAVAGALACAAVVAFVALVALLVTSPSPPQPRSRGIGASTTATQNSAGGTQRATNRANSSGESGASKANATATIDDDEAEDSGEQPTQELAPGAEQTPDQPPPAQEVRFADLTPTRFAWPRSHSSQAEFEAEVCIRANGTVREVAVTKGPIRLRNRIARTLLQWQFEPFAVNRRPVPVCTSVRDRLRRW